MIEALRNLHSIISTSCTNMASFLTLGMIILLVLQVSGRPSKLPAANPLSSYMASARRAYMPPASENYKNDDSSLGGYEDRFNIHHAGYHRNEEDQVYSREGAHQMVVTEDDDSMREENELPLENRHENEQFSNEEMNNMYDPGLDVNENDDSSIEGYRIPFQNHQQAHANADDDVGMSLASENDDTAVISEEHEFLANQPGKYRSYPAEVHSKRARLQVPCIYCCTITRCVANFAHVCHCRK